MMQEVGGFVAVNMVPFDYDAVRGDLEGLDITAKLSRSGPLISLRYEITGRSLKNVFFPEKEESPSRKEELWNTTCLEAFLSAKDQKKYWELNLSPSASWNCYSFDSYRSGMIEEAAVTTLPIVTSLNEEAFVMETRLGLEGIADLSIKDGLMFGLSCVLVTKKGEKSYWALKHCGNRPDFHLRDSFVVSI